MTAEEIRKTTMNDFYSTTGAVAYFVRELAAQLAEIKELLAKEIKQRG